MNSSKVLIVSGLSREEKDFLSVTRFKCIDVNDNMADSTVEDILNGRPGSKGSSKLPNQKIILINGYDNEDIPAVVRLIRSGAGSEAILAVVTETSMKWSFSYLAQHLIQEREWHMKNSRK